MKDYKITCVKCNESTVIGLVDKGELQQVHYPEQGNIISARKRLDGQWGWECTCGNYSIMTAQEQRVFRNPVAPQPQELKEIVDNLEAEPYEDTPDGKLVSGFLMKQEA